MAGQIRLFEKKDGLLVEIAPSEAEKRRASGTISHMNISIDVLWTAEEEAARDAEAALAETQRAEADRQRSEKQALRDATMAKLDLSEDEIKALLS